MKKETTSWGGVADWYDGLLESDPDSYQAKVILPNLTRLLAIEKGDRVLDLACGQGFFSRAWCDLGAAVVAVDISPELIALAKKKGEQNIEYSVSSADNLSFVKDESVDKGVCVLALQNIEQYQKALTEVARVLKKGSSFFLVLNHPTFRIPKESEWGWDEVKQAQYRRLYRYISEVKVEIDMHPGSQSKEKTVSFHRPLQVYFKAFQKAGFVVGRLEEWNSHRKSDSGPRAAAENKARGEFPLFMMIELKKI